MEWKQLSKNEAQVITNQWADNMDTFKKGLAGWAQRLENEQPESYKSLRKDIYTNFCEAKREVLAGNMEKNKAYALDLRFAIKLHKTLAKYGFSLRMASNDKVWMYLCVKVCPDIVYSRFRSEDDKVIPVDHFWRKSRRIYLKTLWWYIHLSWQEAVTVEGSYEETYLILKDNSTDEILNLVERSGSDGYRVDVYREIMAEYSCTVLKKSVKQLLRKVMVLNTARTTLVEPALADGGVKGYVKELYNYFAPKEENA